MATLQDRYPMAMITFPAGPNTSDHLPSHTTKYQFLNEINRGSFGVVYKAIDTRTRQSVAVKLLFHGQSRTASREIDILASLPRHPSIVELKDVIFDDSQRVFVVMDYMDFDLHRLIQSRIRIKTRLTLSEIQTLMRKLLEGVVFLHENGVMHRDLKPSNILVDERKGVLKICDFGLSRAFERNKEMGQYTQDIGTPWYKAPELLLGAEEYSCAIDMWSVGCIMGELLLNRVLFQGSSEIRQLATIYNVLGMPDDFVWPGFSKLPRSGVLIDHLPPFDILESESFPRPPFFSECCCDLISRLLKYDPKKRITAKEALDHAWFEEFC